jgi:hypothetical protein
LHIGVFYLDNFCTGSHTLGLEWTENEYIFTIDGKETCRTIYGNGVSHVDEEVIFFAGNSR